MSKSQEKTRGEVESAVLRSETNREACRLLEVTEDTFVELCCQHGIETPREREKRLTEHHLREGRGIRLARDEGLPDLSAPVGGC